jgi:hypothetical protein
MGYLPRNTSGNHATWVDNILRVFTELFGKSADEAGDYGQEQGSHYVVPPRVVAGKMFYQNDQN